MLKSAKFSTFTMLLLIVAACADRDDSSGVASKAQSGEISYAPIPESIITPDSVETRLGTLEFFDGYPNADTVEAVYDHLDFLRGVRAFLDTIPFASLYAMREGLRESAWWTARSASSRS